MFILGLNTLRLGILLVGASAQAATVHLSASCISSTNIKFVESDNFAFCSNDGATSIARLTGTYGVSASVDRQCCNSSGGASGFYDGFFGLTLTGGTGSGFYVPCLSTMAFNAFASAEFGPDFDTSYQNFCSSQSYSGYGIPFVFGVEQVNELVLSASAGSASGNAQASFGGFHVYDANYQPISGVNVSFQEVQKPTPEPSTVAAVSCGCLLWGILYRARRRRIATPRNHR